MVTIVAKTYLRMLPLSLFSGARSETENQVHLGCSMTFGSPSTWFIALQPALTLTPTHTACYASNRRGEFYLLLANRSTTEDGGKRLGQEAGKKRGCWVTGNPGEANPRVTWPHYPAGLSLLWRYIIVYFLRGREFTQTNRPEHRHRSLPSQSLPFLLSAPHSLCLVFHGSSPCRTLHRITVI